MRFGGAGDDLPWSGSTAVASEKKLTRRAKAGFCFSPSFQVIYGGFETSCLSDPPQLLPESLFIFQSSLMEGSPLAAPCPPVCMYPAESFHCSGKGLKPVCQKSDRGINGLRGGWGVGGITFIPLLVKAINHTGGWVCFQESPNKTPDS